MAILTPPRLACDIAWATNPLADLTDASVAWVDVTSYLELDKEVTISRRRSDELDEPSPGTASAWFNNPNGEFTQLHPASPFAPYVKINRLIRYRSTYPESANLTARQAATGGGDLSSAAGMSAPSGTVTAVTGTATATSVGTTTTLKCLDADATDIEVGDVLRLNPALNANTSFELGTSPWTSAGGTFTQDGTLAHTGTNSGKIVPDGVSALVHIDSALVPVTPDALYAASAWMRNAVARTVILNVNWYDASSVYISTSSNDLVVAATTWTLNSTTFKAPSTAAYAKIIPTMSGTPPASNVMNVDEVVIAPVVAPRTYVSVTGMSASAGTTTITFSPAVAATAAGDVATRSRYQWVTGLQPVAGTRLSTGDTTSTVAGPDAVPVTANRSYTWSAYVERGATAISVSPRLLWYDLTGALIGESAGSTAALTTSLQRLTVTDTAPAGAVLARGALANETVFAGSPTIAYRAGAANKVQSTVKVTVTIPPTVAAGDGMLAWVSCSTTETIATPAGWTAVANVTDGTSPYQGRTWLFKAVATSAGAQTAAGKVVTFQGNSYARKVAVIEAWSGTDPADCVHQQNSAAEGTSYVTTHTTPNVTTTIANCWIASACFDRSTSTSVWTKPAADTLRHAVYTTGSPAATGCVSDNAAAVAAGTYGAKVFTSNVSSDNASMWTVALKPSPTSGSSSATIQVTGAQFEQAGAASAWVAPGVTDIHFVGHANGFPTSYEGGVRPLCSVAAVDRQKLLDAVTLRAAVTEQVLSTDPVCFYPLTEDSGATGAGNAAAVSQPELPIVSAGSVTDDMLQFGGGTGPGTDAQQALKLAPTSTTVGKALRGRLTTPLGGDGVTAMTVMVTFLYPNAGDGNLRVIGGCDDGKPTDGGAVGIFDINGDSTTPKFRAHLKFAGGAGYAVDFYATQATDYFDKRTHQAVATAELAEGVATVKLYVDGVLKQTATSATTATEFPEYNRWNIGCGANDNIGYLMTGTLSYMAGWNTALTAAQITDLYSATVSGFSGDLSGARATRLAAWAGVATTAFDPGQQRLEGHRAEAASLKDNLRLIARSEGGQFFLSSGGYATIHDRARRINAASGWTVSATDVKGDLAWLHDDQLLANRVTVKRTKSEAVVNDLVSQFDDGYGVRDGDAIDTIVETDGDALARAQAHLARYAQPVSRPGEVAIEMLGRPELYDSLRGAEVSDKFTVTGLPSTAPATSADLFVEGVGMQISDTSWLVTLDVSPASFDFGLILDDPVRGVLDSNYVGW